MDNNPDYEYMDDYEIMSNNERQQSFKISEHLKNSLETNETQENFPGLTKGIPKTFICSLKQYILESFSQHDISSDPELNYFMKINPQTYSKAVLQDFLAQPLGRLVGDEFFGCGKFCKYIIANNKTMLSLNEFFKEVPKYYQIKKCNYTQEINYEQFFYLNEQSQNQFENRSTVSWEDGEQMDDGQLLKK